MHIKDRRHYGAEWIHLDRNKVQWRIRVTTNELPSGSKEGTKFPDLYSAHQLLEDSTPWRLRTHTNRQTHLFLMPMAC